MLEARDRIGGRVWSRPVAGMPSPAELGAEFIHGPAPETMELLRLAGAGAAIRGEGGTWCSDGEGGLHADDGAFSEGAEQIFAQARGLERDESVEAFLRRFEGDERLRGAVETARAFAEGFDAVDPAVAGVRGIAAELASGVDDQSARPLGGYIPIFRRLRELAVAAGAELALSTAVRRIAWRRGAVRVEAENARGERRTVRARRAVVTLPVGVLRDEGEASRIVFDPALPPETLGALRGIEMGHVVKVVLRFRSAFWEELHGGRYRDAGFFRDPAGAFAAYWTHVPERSRLITAWAGGTKAIALAGEAEERWIELALEGFGALLGERSRARHEFEGALVHDWDRDPYARGAYSYLAVGAEEARALLAVPLEETIFFAGEATANDGQGGTVNGALATGERAAHAAAASLRAT